MFLRYALNDGKVLETRRLHDGEVIPMLRQDLHPYRQVEGQISLLYHLGMSAVVVTGIRQRQISKSSLPIARV
jgi:hypothetical protein